MGHVAVVTGADAVESGGLGAGGRPPPVGEARSLDVPGVPPDSSRNATDGTSMWMSMRSSSGPLILHMYFSICGGVQWQLRRVSPR